MLKYPWQSFNSEKAFVIKGNATRFCQIQGTTNTPEPYNFLCRVFANVKFEDFHREANKITHILACNCNGANVNVLHHEPLGFVLTQLAADVTVLFK